MAGRLIDNGTTPDPARIDMAMGILGPLEANAPTDACYRIIGLKAMLNLAMGDGEKARELAEQAIGYDASDRFASDDHSPVERGSAMSFDQS